jgi:DNA-binding MarR family transcriptional regulator
MPGGSRRVQTPWLTSEQLDAWMSLTLLMAQLPPALEEQLKRDAALSYLEYYTLAGLSDHPDHTMRLSTIAAVTKAELSRISHLVSRLERRGFVRREPDPTDGRYTNAVLTEAGHAHLVASAPAHVRTVRELVIDVIDPEALATLKACADQINQRIGCNDPAAP